MNVKKLTEEQINANYIRYINALKKYECYSDELFAEYGEKIKTAPYARDAKMGGAYDGGMIDVTLNILCKIGYNINNRVLGLLGNSQNQEECKCFVNNHMLMRAMLLINLSKALFFKKETESWRIKNGLFYDFEESTNKLNKGEKTLYMCNKYGIKLSEDECECLLYSDKEDTQGTVFLSPLTLIVMAANRLTSKELLLEATAE